MLSDQALCQDPKGGQKSAPTNPPLRIRPYEPTKCAVKPQQEIVWVAATEVCWMLTL